MDFRRIAEKRAWKQTTKNNKNLLLCLCVCAMCMYTYICFFGSKIFGYACVMRNYIFQFPLSFQLFNHLSLFSPCKSKSSRYILNSFFDHFSRIFYFQSRKYINNWICFVLFFHSIQDEIAISEIKREKKCIES